MTKKPPVDVYQQVTDSIIRSMQQSDGTVTLPWQRTGLPTSIPKNASTDAFYNGCNILSLWCSADENNYPVSLWGSYKQWQALGAQVRGGEKGTLIAFYKQFDVNPNPERSDDDGKRYVARASYVFNVNQVDGYDLQQPSPMPALEQHESVTRLIKATNAVVRYGGDRAYYSPGSDFIQMPDDFRFRQDDPVERTAAQACVLFHEATHWSGAKHRLDRQFGKRFGDDQYAAEEVVAELTASFLAAQLGVSSVPREDHAHYIKNWLNVMKKDNRAIFNAAARASEAARYLTGFLDKEEAHAA